MSTLLHNRAHAAFDALSEGEKREAIITMAAMGYGPYVIASAANLSVEQVRAILAEREREE